MSIFIKAAASGVLLAGAAVGGTIWAYDRYVEPQVEKVDIQDLRAKGIQGVAQLALEYGTSQLTLNNCEGVTLQIKEVAGGDTQLFVVGHPDYGTQPVTAGQLQSVCPYVPWEEIQRVAS